MSARNSLRHLAALFLVAAIASPATIARASQETSHERCKVQGHGCGQGSAMSCSCCDDDQKESSTPAQSPSGRTLVNAPHQVTGPVPAFVAQAITNQVSSAALRSYSPPHGYQSTDLSILFSTFLI